ncbi:MAG: hypothetical protein N2246_05035, partial [Candidatus Sumerlaeia bacterium]|nr:hypothetical protein [Candidatus Sumerlaeia bacterium]
TDLLLVGKEFVLFRTSAENGKFEFSNLPAGEYYIEPLREGKRIGKAVLFKCDGKTPISELVVKVNQGINISGIVISAEDRNPVGDILLGIEKGEGEIKTALSETSGKFYFTEIIPAGEVIIKILSPDYSVRTNSDELQGYFSIEGFMPEDDITDIVIPVIKRYKICGIVENITTETLHNYSVKLIRAKDKPISRNIKINKDFKFEVEVSGSGDYIAGLINEKGQLVGEVVEFTLSPTKPIPFIKLRPSEPMIINGLVLDHIDAPLAECKVFVSGKFTSSQFFSDVNGEFMINTYEKQLKIEVSSSHYSQKLEKEIILPLKEPLIFKFKLENLLSGIVVDTKDNIVPKARINYCWSDYATGKEHTNTITADNEGKFQITDVKSDVINRLICEGPLLAKKSTLQYGRAELSNIKLPQENFKIVLPLGIDLKISVVDEHNSPYSGELTLTVNYLNPATQSFTVAFKEIFKVSNGTFKLTGLNSGTYMLTGKTNDGRYGNSDEITLNESNNPAEAQIKLQTTAVIFGYVYDKQTELALNDVNVVYQTSKTEGEQVIHTTTTDEKGYFELKGLADGETEINFIKAGYSSKNHMVCISNGVVQTKLPLSVYLEPGESAVYGMVMDMHGKPIPSVVLTLQALWATNEWQSHIMTTHSDSNGEFKFNNICAGNYLLIAEKNSLFASENLNLQPQEKKELKLKLLKKILVSGRLNTNDKSLYQHPLIFTNSTTHRNFVAQMNAEGKFETLLPAGVYTINVGETELTSTVSISPDTETYELELTF